MHSIWDVQSRLLPCTRVSLTTRKPCVYRHVYTVILLCALIILYTIIHSACQSRSRAPIKEKLEIHSYWVLWARFTLKKDYWARLMNCYMIYSGIQLTWLLCSTEDQFVLYSFNLASKNLYFSEKHVKIN